MKKNHKYGEDICYYREIDEKFDYAVYYVKPCEKGQYCENQISNNQPFGFCRDILTKPTNFASYGEACSSNGECQEGLFCDSTCKKDCSTGQVLYRFNYNNYRCMPDTYKKLDEKICEWYDPNLNTEDPKYFIDYKDDVIKGKYPGLPKECGIIRYTTITDYDPYSCPTGPSSCKSFTRYIKQSKEWCSIGEAKDGDFVTGDDAWRFCKSGFTLKFFPNGGLDDPSKDSQLYPKEYVQMCVTPIEIDQDNPLVDGCVITYKIGENTEQKYNAEKYEQDCDGESVIKSKIYTEFIEEFNNASEEDKINCYLIPQGSEGDCQNIKLLKLYYFYNHIEDYLFYKDREKLEKVLDFKIQQQFHRYYQSSTYFNLNFIFYLLILILL